MTALALTAAGRAAIADADHVGTEAVTLTHLAFGDGLRPPGADDDARAALRRERDREAVAGREAADGHVAVVADWTPTRAYAITEIGLIATVDGAPVLLAYGAVEAASDAVARTAIGTRIVVALDVAVTSSAADLSVTLSPTVQFSATAAATTAVAGVARRATGAEAQAAADATQESDRAALAVAPYLSPREAARIPIALRAALSGGAAAGRDTLDGLYDTLVGGAPADRNTLAKLATALETEVQRRITMLSSPWENAASTAQQIALAPLIAGNVAGAQALANLGFRLPAGNFLVDLYERGAGGSVAIYRGVVPVARASLDNVAARVRLAQAARGSSTRQTTHHRGVLTLAAPTSLTVGSGPQFDGSGQAITALHQFSVLIEQLA